MTPSLVCEEPICVCVVCNQPSENDTCSHSCAAKLAHSTMYVNKVKEIMKTPEKGQCYKMLLKELQGTAVKNQNSYEVRILDFWGGGGFVDYLLDQRDDVKNHHIIVYTIDKDKRLHPALKKYARDKNQLHCVKNRGYSVIPFCGSLTRFVQKNIVKNHCVFDLVWLDYCGTLVGIKEDLETVSKITNRESIIAVTLFKGRDGVINAKGRLRLLDEWMGDSFPLHRRIKTENYKKLMEFYVYKVPAYIKKGLPMRSCEEPDMPCTPLIKLRGVFRR